VNVAVPPTSRSTLAFRFPLPLAGQLDPAEAAHVQVTPLSCAGKTSLTIAPVTDVDIPATLYNGAIVAGVTVEPYVSAMVANGTGEIVTRMAKYIGGAYNVIVFPSEFAKQNREAVKRFVVAHARAMQFLRQRSMDSVPMVNKWIPESKPDVLKGTLGFYAWDLRFTNEAMDGLQRDLDFQTRLGWIRKKLDVQALIDVSFIQEVEREYPQYFDDLKK